LSKRPLYMGLECRAGSISCSSSESVSEDVVCTSVLVTAASESAS